MSIPMIVALCCLFSLSVAYITLFYRFLKLRGRYEIMFVDLAILEQTIDESENSKVNLEESIHKENFTKFISDSRDWAFKYIEDVQQGISNFVDELEPEINYFKEYGDISSMAPNYYSMKKFVEGYEKIKMLLPKEEDNK